MERARVFIPLLLIAAACSEEGNGNTIHKVEHRLLQIEAKLDRPSIAAGARAKVECVGSYTDGSVSNVTDAVVSVSPTNGVEVSGFELRGVRVGTYTVTCTKDDAEKKTAELVVRDGAPAQIIALLAQSEAPAGIPVEVRCYVEDAEGNRTESSTANVESQPGRGMNVSGRQITGERPGTYSVSCTQDALPSVPATITITAGAPVSITATLDRYTVLAGERVEVRCTLSDAYGNDVAIPAAFSATPSPASSDDQGFVPTTAGEYAVVCELASAGLRSDPVALTVNPGLPAMIEIVDVLPNKPIYGRTDAVELVVSLHDAYGNEVPAASTVVASVPQEAAVPSGPRSVVLIGDGSVELVIAVSSPTHQNTAVTDSVSLIVDGTPPEIEIQFPSRAEIVTAQPGVPITIRGRVTDTVSPIGAVMVNGQMASVDASGGFTARMTPEWGINVIDANAADSAGNTRSLIQSFELASEYRRAGPTQIVAGRIMDGIIAHLGQAALDDNNSDVDDLATIARLAVERLDINALIPDPVTTFNSDCSVLFVTIRGSLRLYVDNVTFGRPIIDINAIPGGLRVRVEVPNIYVAMHTSGDVCDIGLGLSGSATASRVVVEGNVLVSAQNGVATVSMPQRNVQISGLRINLNLPSIIDWAVDGIINLFAGAIANRLESAFGDVIRDEIPRVIKGFLESIELGTSFALPAPLSLSLGVNARLGMLSFDSDGGDLGNDTTIYAAGALSPEPAGGILQEVQTIPQFGSARALGVALGYDLVNQALYSLWYGGGLRFDLDEAFFPAQQMNGGQMINAQASLEALLPPVLAPSGDPSWPVEVQVGDLKLDVDLQGISGLPPIQATIYAAAFLQANVGVNAAGEVILGLGPNSEIYLDFATQLDGIIDLAAFSEQLSITLETLLPQLVGQVLRGIPLPTLDLSSIAGGYLPPNIRLRIGNATTRFHPSYVILEGDLVQVP
jgi:hypothetical protein